MAVFGGVEQVHFGQVTQQPQERLATRLKDDQIVGILGRLGIDGVQLVEQLQLASVQEGDIGVAAGQLGVVVVDALGEGSGQGAERLALELGVLGDGRELVARVVAADAGGAHRRLAVVAVEAVGAGMKRAVVDGRRFSDDVPSRQGEVVVLDAVLLAQIRLALVAVQAGLLPAHGAWMLLRLQRLDLQVGRHHSL